MKLHRLLIVLLISMIGVARVMGGETNYFLVAPPPAWGGHNDSYVLPLSNPDDIEYARYLVSRSRFGFLVGDRTIVVGWVFGPKDGINRNYLNPKFPEWSWQVRFVAFAQLTPEIWDGNPTSLERTDWSGGGEYKIGFWDYTVVRELGPVPLYLSIIPEGQNLQLYWSGVGTNYVYTLESKDSLASTNWAPVPGAVWPLKTNHWTLPQTNATASFFRVKAEASR
jgi:hypothetical protein